MEKNVRFSTSPFEREALLPDKALPVIKKLRTLFHFTPCVNFIRVHWKYIVGKIIFLMLALSFIVVPILLLVLHKPKNGHCIQDVQCKGWKRAQNGRFQYMYSVHNSDTEAHICAGILVHKKWILTAASCIQSKIDHSVVLIPHSYHELCEREGKSKSKTIETTKCSLHHLWNNTGLTENDIAMCDLQTSATAARPNLEKACTAKHNYSLLSWNNNNNNNNNNIENKHVEELYIKSDVEFDPSSSTSEKNNTDPIEVSMLRIPVGCQDDCKRDPGEPLFEADNSSCGIESGDPRLDRIVGIYSNRKQSPENCAFDVYTNISCYIPWINCMKKGKENCRRHNPCQMDSSYDSV